MTSRPLPYRKPQSLTLHSRTSPKRKPKSTASKPNPKPRTARPRTAASPRPRSKASTATPARAPSSLRKRTPPPTPLPTLRRPASRTSSSRTSRLLRRVGRWRWREVWGGWGGWGVRGEIRLRIDSSWGSSDGEEGGVSYLPDNGNCWRIKPKGHLCVSFEG